jgi:exodeoxyribonuclease VII small subunit
MSEKSKKLSIEESFDYLDEVIEKMEDPDISLEDSFKLYEKGMTAAFQTNRAGLPFRDIPPRAAEDYEATLRDVMRLIKTAEDMHHTIDRRHT